VCVTNVLKNSDIFIYFYSQKNKKVEYFKSLDDALCQKLFKQKIMLQFQTGLSFEENAELLLAWHKRCEEYERENRGDGRPSEDDLWDEVFHIKWFYEEEKEKIINRKKKQNCATMCVETLQVMIKLKDEQFSEIKCGNKACIGCNENKNNCDEKYRLFVSKNIPFLLKKLKKKSTITFFLSCQKKEKIIKHVTLL